MNYFASKKFTAVLLTKLFTKLLCDIIAQYIISLIKFLLVSKDRRSCANIKHHSPQNYHRWPKQG